MDRPVRLLLTIPNFDTAGSGKVVYDLAKGIDKENFEVEIACGHDKGSFFKEVEKLGLPIHIYETKTPYRPYFSLPIRVWKISKFYRKNKFDIIHSWQWSSDWTEALAARIVNKKWIYTKKAMGFSSRHWKIKSKLANHIITINKDMQKYFARKKHKSLIPLGLDTSHYSPDKFQKEKSPNFTIISVANMVAVKGIETLIAAVQKIGSPKIKLKLLGDDTSEYGKYLHDLVVSENLQQQVEFCGKHNDVRPFLGHADLFVIPTLNEGRREGMPMALVEAMSMAVPVLGSNISGIKYVLRDFDELLFEAGSSEALKQKIEFILNLDHQERIKIGNDLRNYCKANYTLDNFVKNHERLYLKLMKN